MTVRSGFLTRRAAPRAATPVVTAGPTRRTGPAEAVWKLQRTYGNAWVARNLSHASPAVRRQREEAAAVTASVPFAFGTLTTFRQLAGAARLVAGQIRHDLEDVDAYDPVRGRAAEWLQGMEGWIPYLERRGDDPLTAPAAEMARGFLDDATKLRGEIRAAKEARLVRELWRAHDRALEAREEAAKLKPKLDDALRAAYRAGDDKLITQVLDVVGNVTDIGLGIHELARGIAEQTAKLAGIQLQPVSQFTEALGKLNKGLAAINLAISLAEEEATTELEEGMRELTVAAGAFSALGTLAGLPPHMGLYANLYLVPMTKAIMAGITRLTETLHSENKTWVELVGKPQYFGAEPGGEPMWDFMVAVMHAKTPRDVPSLPAKVREYLLEHRGRLETGAGEAVPTTGWWFWREIDSPRAREWIFDHRDRVWAMFYGSMPVPARRGA